MSTFTEITVSQEVPAPIEDVFAAWTDAERLATWWWPMWPDTSYDVDARAGGAYAIRSATGGVGVHGVFVTIDPPRRLELTWVWEDDGVDGPEERVLVELAPQGAGTLVSVRHTTEAAGAEDFRQGWTHCLARLGGQAAAPA